MSPPTLRGCTQMLRLEGIAILWVVAMACVAANFWPRAADADRAVSSDPVETASVGYVAAAAKPDSRFPRVLPEPPATGRNLFEVVEVVESQQPVPPTAPMPLLRGVISDGQTIRAVFATAPDGSGTVTAALSDSVGDYRVDAITPDDVTLAGPDGKTITLKLRGSGELP